MGTQQPDDTLVYTRSSPVNRSLERGMEILRAFRPGLSVLTNGELAGRTGLARSTVSRLTQTLVEGGFLRYDFAARAYCLGAPLLSLAYAMQQGSAVLKAALPLMREIAEGQRINVGLAVADGTEMVYLESVRRHRGSAFRHIAGGSRIPMELTSLGRAHLATLAKKEFDAMLAALRGNGRTQWPALAKAIRLAVAAVKARGYCVAAWQPGVIAIAAPLRLPREPGYALNISIAGQQMTEREIGTELAPLLLKLVAQIQARLQAGV
jgi:DNA-binding IclR family transcriptional regulator